jgi:hypothetical protein
MILPGEQGSAQQPFSADDALAHTVLTFRDAAGFRWIRKQDGKLFGQSRDTARESVLVALRLPLPEPPDGTAPASPASP